MVNLFAAINKLHPELVPGVDYTLGSDDAGNPVIKTWTSTTVAQPTADQITAADTALNVATAQAAAITTLSTAYQAALTAPISYMGTTFPGDAATQQLIGQAMTVYAAIGSTPDGFYFVDANNNKVPMTLAQLQGLGAAVASSYWATFQHWTSVREQVYAATTVADVQAVTW